VSLHTADEPQSEPKGFSMTPLTMGETVRISFGPFSSPALAEQGELPSFAAKITEVRGSTLAILVFVEDGVRPPQVSAEIPITLLEAAEGRALLYHATIEEVVSERPLLLQVTTPERVVELQRRSFFRLGIEMEVKYAAESAGWAWRRAAVRDLSEGGICLMDTAPRYRGDQILVELPLEKETLTLRGTVRRCYEGSSVHLLGIQFSGIVTKDQQKIRKFIFAQQAKRLRVTRE
jgi:hypothetical protein